MASGFLLSLFEMNRLTTVLTTTWDPTLRVWWLRVPSFLSELAMSAGSWPRAVEKRQRGCRKALVKTAKTYSGAVGTLEAFVSSTG